MSSLSRLIHWTFNTSLSSSSTPSQLNPNIVRYLSNVLYKERNLKKLVEKFKKSSKSDRFRTKIGVYESTFRRLAFTKCFRWIEEILEIQKKYRDVSKEVFIIQLISLYGKSGMFKQASKVFDEMPDYNVIALSNLSMPFWVLVSIRGNSIYFF
ncbi:hypothetical protein CsSME_00030704 [Camellia sinensis var. sinensis]